jgi:hypothetical protein
MNDYLRIYLNDQLALGTAWRELARRSSKANKGSDVGTALTKVATGIAEDVATFRGIMKSLAVPENPVKSGAAVVGERLGRLKMNGRLRSYSPLSRFEELEFLTMGIDGKKQLWVTLRDLAGLAERLPDVDFDELITRAQAQRDELEPFRARAGKEALAGA